MRKSLLVIALSARPFVVAAKQAGYVVTVIDAFADQPTLALAEAAFVVDYDDCGFNAATLLQTIRQLEASQYLGFVYGSGFEAQPALLQAVAKTIPLLGNNAATVAAVKTFDGFFSVLKKQHILYPEVLNVLPRDVESTLYLTKFMGGCGGTHITTASAATDVEQTKHYYQRFIDGDTVSLLFVANRQQIAVVGFNAQWLNPTARLPFRYGGAVNHIALPIAIQQQLENAATLLTTAFGLVGLNSLDAVVKDGLVYVLEINPRLSATVGLYDNNLMKAHITACVEGSLPVRCKNSVNQRANAHAILYAVSDINIAASFTWPSWAVDTPQLALPENTRHFLAGAPICTVLACAENTAAAKQLAHARITILQQLLPLS